MKLRLVPLAVLTAVALATPLAAAGFPDITAEERNLTSVPGEPNAPAVVLFRNAEFRMLDSLGADSGTSTFAVRVRRKILTEQGKSYGEVTIHHSRLVRLLNLTGRTVLPDGRVLPLPDNAIFKRRTSQSAHLYETSIAFPAVAVGAILDYQYEVKIDSVYHLEPWYFQEDVPTLYSEIVYQIPDLISANGWMRDPMRTGIQQERKKTLQGTKVKVWGKNLPAVPVEPDSLPFADLAARFMLVPTAVGTSVETIDLLKSWPSTCDLYGDSYESALRKSGDAADRAKAIVAKLPPGASARERAQALYRFVRDEIENEDLPGVAVRDKASADATLTARRGDSADKAVLLLAMLRAQKIEGRLVWAAERSQGLVDMQLANPWWFDQVLVAAEIDGHRTYLDPTDRSLSFASLPPDLEGTTALLYDRKKPESVVLPAGPFVLNLRQVKIDLTLDAKGRLSGGGELNLNGHHAWQRLHWKDDADKTKTAWQEWLAKAFPEYALSDLKVEEVVDERRVAVTWKMAEREEQVLGDEATLTPSRPLGPFRQPYRVAAEKRVSPVLVAFPDREELELTLRWPEGWKVEGPPPTLQRELGIGTVTATYAVDPAART
ncbi:MAG TPA: DUF3857 and transglutaminase domain-containing protein, partial [Thermoanaerobaculia bacterium]